MEALECLLAEREKEAFRLAYIAQVEWLIMRTHYKETPLESYTEITGRMNKPQDTRTAEEIREDVLARLRKE